MYVGRLVGVHVKQENPIFIDVHGGYRLESTGCSGWMCNYITSGKHQGGSACAIELKINYWSKHFNPICLSVQFNWQTKCVVSRLDVSGMYDLAFKNFLNRAAN